jgi:two-component system LytT family response regulator
MLPCRVSIRALIVDDDALARYCLRSLLKGEAEVGIAGECADDGNAAAAIREQPGDQYLLEVQTPVLDGFGVLEAALDR